MTQRVRFLIAVLVLALLIIVVVGVDALRRSSSSAAGTGRGEPTLTAGSIPIYVDGRLVGSFNSSDLETLEMVSFRDEEEGKKQEGWLLRDVILVHVEGEALSAQSQFIVGSSSRKKSAELSWAEVDDPANWVMFDLASKGTLKLVSTLESLDTRDEWIQDVDSIEVETQ